MGALITYCSDQLATVVRFKYGKSLQNLEIAELFCSSGLLEWQPPECEIRLE
jgi:hypothetical protein